VNDPQTVLPDSLCIGLIAPCGMDCGLCRGHIREQKCCAGCNGDDASKPRSCLTCKIKTCDKIAGGTVAFCFDCDRFPCPRLRRLDTRYRTKYGMSMVDNLRSIQEVGVEAFVAAEKVRWACPQCGSLLCVHRPDCSHCGRTWNAGASAHEENRNAGAAG
jgi:hypothetical protein